MRVRIGVAVLLLAPAVASTVAAQGTTSRLVGQVTDATGGVLPGVTATLTNDATGVTFTTATTGAGTYVFEALPSGSYSVKFELQGFKTFVSQANRVVVGQPTTVDAQLAPCELAETVQVTGRTEVVQTTNSGNLGSVIDQKTIEAFPLVSGGGRGRNPLDMVLIQPGGGDWGGHQRGHFLRHRQTSGPSQVGPGSRLGVAAKACCHVGERYSLRAGLACVGGYIRGVGCRRAPDAVRSPERSR